MLVAGRPAARIGEIGTGTGYGTAWMVSAMAPDAELVTVEIDAGRAAVARDLFAGDDRVTVVEGDAGPVIHQRGPYDLLFVDGGSFGRDVDVLRALIGLVPVGGRLVVDDLTPTAVLPPDSPFHDHDAKRTTFLDTPSLVSVEVVAPTLRESALVGTRIR